MTVRSMTYFRQTYGIDKSITMFHRIRAWHRSKAKRAETLAEQTRHRILAETFDAYIKVAKSVWVIARA